MAQPFVATAEPVTAANYKFVLSYPIFAEAVRTSVTLGAMAATLIVAITFVIAWIAQRIARRYGWLLDLIAFMPIAVPSVIIGASVLFAYLILPIPVYNTIWILLIAYLTAYLPYGIGSRPAASRSCTRSWRRPARWPAPAMARSSSASCCRCWRRWRSPPGSTFSCWRCASSAHR
jgi:ABC-type Fe3+ transport system permease subunit